MVKLGGLSEESNMGFGYEQATIRLDVSDLDIRYRCMGITAFYGAPLQDAAALTLLQGVYDAGTPRCLCRRVTSKTRGSARRAGCRHFDTAEIYKTGNPFADGIDRLIAQLSSAPSRTIVV